MNLPLKTLSKNDADTRLNTERKGLKKSSNKKAKIDQPNNHVSNINIDLSNLININNKENNSKEKNHGSVSIF